MLEEALHAGYATFSTFAQVIASNIDRSDSGYTFIQEDESERFVSWSELSREALHRGHKLLLGGLRKGERIALIIPDGLEFILTFLGAVSVGIVPVPMYPPMTFGNFEVYLGDAANILRAAGACALLMPRSMRDALASLIDDVEGLRPVVSDEFFAEPVVGSAPQPEAILPEDVMFLQFTSGSTAAPKGVRVTHASSGHGGAGNRSRDARGRPRRDGEAGARSRSSEVVPACCGGLAPAARRPAQDLERQTAAKQDTAAISQGRSS